MAGAAHFFPSFQQAMETQSSTRPSFVSGSVDTLKIGLINSSATFNWVAATEAYSTVSQLLANAGTGGGTSPLVEVSGGGYARQTLAGVSVTTAGLVTTLTATSPINFPTATANYGANYAFIYDYTAGGGSDTAGLLVAYWDFGGTLSVVSGGNISLAINAAGITTWTAS